MKIVMTLMVRDEADILGAMLEHHYAQGIDHVIATDNASGDGTTEILEAYAERGLLTLHHDPRHEKQQSEVVTRMAREAAVVHGATWVVNADADEFWVAEDPAKTLREALERIPIEYGAFNVPVTDMTGTPALEGSGIDRLIYRDERPLERINALGHHAHATHDVVFVADPEVEVAQGNHFVSVESKGSPNPGEGIEVLHLPWRSWKQVSTKVRNSGLAYERSGLTPSPNHHGMRDYRRLNRGTLYSIYLARHPRELERSGEHLIEDRRLADSLTAPVEDVPIPAGDWERLGDLAESIVAMEREQAKIEQQRNELEHRNQSLAAQNRELAGQLRELSQQIGSQNTELLRGMEELRAENEALRGSKVFRAAHALGRVLLGR